MAKVVAKVRGYFGGMIREPGTIFTVPDDRKAPGWTRPYAFAGKGDHDGDGKTGGSKPAEKSVEKTEADDETAAIVVPADWRNGNANKRKALAKAITGEAVTHVADADRIIEQYVEAQKPEAFSDAPEPETVKGNGVTEALGGAQPDWIAPDGDGKTGG